MTNKELLYVEDALKHAKHFDALCYDACDHIEDYNLRNFVQDVKDELQIVYDGLFKTLK